MSEDLARLRFQSQSKPKESGKLLLSDDGTFRIEPSPAFRDAIADLETAALARSSRYGLRLGLLFAVIGGILMALGWLAGRRGGALGETFGQPRSLNDVELTRDGGGIQVILKSGKWTKTTMAWNSDEILQADADTFQKAFDEIKKS